MLTVGMYKTRDSDDVKIVAIEDGVAIGYIVEKGVSSGLTTWRADSGSYYLDGDEDDVNDLIDTKPRIKFERWATVYRNERVGQLVGGLHETLEKAKLAKANAVQVGEIALAIARVEIDCTEGENLD